MKKTLLVSLLVLSISFFAGCSLSTQHTDDIPDEQDQSAPVDQQDDSDLTTDDSDDDEINKSDDNENEVENKYEDNNTANAPAATGNEAPTTTYTLAEVAIHNTASSCRTTIRGNIYDVTAFIDKHPGGDQNILKLCGIDGTSLFENKHGGQSRQEMTLEGFEIGVLAQ